MKVIVTGGAGFIGSHLVDYLVQQGIDVTIVDSLDPQVHPEAKKPPYLNKKARFIKADVSNYQKMLKIIPKTDVIFHFAAAVGVGQSQYQIKHYNQANVMGTATILDILANRKNRLKKFILASSMSCYGEGAYMCKNCGRVRPGSRKQTDLEKCIWEPACPLCGNSIVPVGVNEDDGFLCTSIYACTKMMQEEMVMNFARAYQKPAVALRFFNVYGTRQSLSNPYTGVIAIFISRIKNKKSPVIYEDGRQLRDFVSVHDVVRASFYAMQKEEANFQVFNVGTGITTSVLDIAYQLSKLMNFDKKPLLYNKYRQGDIRHCFSDITKIKNILGYQPQVSLDEGLKELVEWSLGQKAIDKFDRAHRELVRRKLI